MNRNQRRISKKRKNKTLSNAEKYYVDKEFSTLGVVLQKTVNMRKISQTDFKQFPSKVIVGFGENNKQVMIEFSSDIEQNKQESDLISGFFSQMKTDDTFEIVKSTSEYADGTMKKKDLLAGTYKFLRMTSDKVVIAEFQGNYAQSMYHTVLTGKYFIRPLQFKKTTTLNSNRPLSKLINYLSTPSLVHKGIDVGLRIEIEGTDQNDGIYTVIDRNVYENDGREEFTLSPRLNLDEDRLGKHTTIKVMRKGTSSRKRDVGPFAVNGTSSTGTTIGQKGFYYPLYTSSKQASLADSTNTTSALNLFHTHKFSEYGDQEFYMPNSDMNHARPDNGGYSIYPPPKESRDTIVVESRTVSQPGSEQRTSTTTQSTTQTTSNPNYFSGGSSSSSSGGGGSGY